MTTLAPPAPDRATTPAGVTWLLLRVRARWRRVILARALVLGPAMGLAAALALLLLDLAAPLPAAARGVLRWLPLAVFIGVAARGLLRAARPPADRRLALLVEERVPSLENRLATGLELDAGGPDESPVVRAFRRELASRIGSVDARGVVPLRLRRPALLLLGAAAAALALALLLPGPAREAWARWTDPADAYETAWEERRAETLPLVPPAPVPGFDELRWRIRPPAYTGMPEREARGPEGLTLLPGSRVRLRSRFPGRWSAVRARRVGGGTLPVRRSGGEWSVEWTQAAERGIALEALAAGEVVDRRIVPVTVAPDNPPEIALREPVEDLVVASARGRIGVRATASDDFGVGELRLTWIRSRGSGESFSFEEGEWGWSRVARSGRVVVAEHTVDLAALGLRPGDMVHLRAVARDRNTVTGPGESVSQTRVIRVARPEELDRVNTVVGIPPELAENPVLSQRMLILMTERLRDRAPRIGRAATLEESTEIGHEQGRLRDRVGEQLFSRSTGGLQPTEAHARPGEQGGAHEHQEGRPQTPGQVLEEASRATGQGTRDEVEHRHDEAPVVAVNQRLLAIYNAMWAAERELNQGDPAASLPHQYAALRLIKEAQQGERRFVRGTVRVDPVDVPAARGTGKLDEAAPAERRAGPATPSLLLLLAELDRAAGRLWSRAPREVSLELTALAGEALAAGGADPRAAALLARAA
ncbi:MAG TPA: hypothetical protein VHG28_18420, partial [Longimicrobiaceae bacterium]|nr:hypothetical protein [Longimicrobiaceae bacterium]